MRFPRRVRSPRRALTPPTLVTTLLLAMSLTAGLAGPAGAAGARAQDPRLTRDLYLNQTSQAYQAGQADPRFAAIGATPQAYWMSDSWMPLDQVQQISRTYADKAKAAGQTPLVAIYAIPARDCGSYSAGGFTAPDYRTWIARMAKGLRGSKAMAILEPDALGHLGACDGQGDRTGLLRWATRKLARAGVWVYLDAAHSAWVEPAEMARRLQASGVRWARGFSTNIASFVSGSVDESYARKINKTLKSKGITGKHWITDTSRNGAGKVDGNDWCNPLDARLGRAPGMVGRGFLDGYVWAKSPGESDGPCNGGPAAGLWWPDYALRLMGQV